MRYTRADPPPPEPRTQGRPPRGADDAERLARLYASLYLREWKAPPLDLHPLYASAHRRAVDAMFAALRRYGPDLLRDLAWTTPERWQHYAARYGVEPAGDLH